MPIQFECEEGIVTLRMVGRYAPADIRAALLAALDDPRGGPTAGLLFDVRASTSLADRPTEAIREMARFLASYGARFGGRMALLATADYAFGLMRMGSVIVEAEGVAAQTFRDEAEARAWLLGRPPVT